MFQINRGRINLALSSAAFCTSSAGSVLLHIGFAEERHPHLRQGQWQRDAERVSNARQQLQEYFSGQRQHRHMRSQDRQTQSGGERDYFRLRACLVGRLHCPRQRQQGQEQQQQGTDGPL